MTDNTKSRSVIRGPAEGDVVVPIIKSAELTIMHPPIGKGQFGKVYKGKCRGIDVAVKVLDGIAWDNSVRDDFVEEVSVMVRLIHPNIVLCMGACVEEESGQNHYAIILEYMPKGDLHTLLHDSKVPMPLPRMLQCGIDICKGMAWLSGQQILHRDLKPANVLVDQNWTCKICDFGLSQIQKTKQKIQDEDEAAGSVLWMAPEVLLKKKIDSKIDVYSFSLVFWEILSRDELFSQFEDKEDFTEAITVRDVRPPLEKIHPYLQTILSSGWNKDPAQRPTFEEFLTHLQKSLIEIYLPSSLCPLASQFWEKYFRGKSKAPWDQFVKRFAAHLGKRHPKIPLEIACLEKLVAEEEGGEKFVTIERFSCLLKWFGKMKDNQDILTRILNVMSQDWFFGAITSTKAEEDLKYYKAKPGTFLVRLNMGGGIPIEKAPFTISRVDSRGKIVHTRVQISKTGVGLLIKFGSGESKTKISHNSLLLEEFMKCLMSTKPELFAVPCPGFPFKSITSQEKSVYDDVQSSNSEEEE